MIFFILTFWIELFFYKLAYFVKGWVFFVPAKKIDFLWIKLAERPYDWLETRVTKGRTKIQSIQSSSSWAFVSQTSLAVIRLFLALSSSITLVILFNFWLSWTLYIDISFLFVFRNLMTLDKLDSILGPILVLKTCYLFWFI